ncbi:hypothetical protein C8K36_1189 [Rhodococcus sp. OK519]|uniref:hypothetical protein n=1 Tax=Rhodococcus sp. OK519 TaxID=2135729 RepID=UPI000D347A26|nr:hypothetical protein C8K36_1189 [Rhodococcus sp. OK519]
MSTAPNTAFLSMSRVVEPQHHRTVNAWHQLDHRPENLALPGVTTGERFVLTPRGREIATAAGSFDNFHYANLYWFDDPAGPAIDTWAALAESTFREGRRPDIGLLERPYMGFFQRVASAIAPHVRVTPRAVCFRPVTGMLLHVRAFGPGLARAELHEQLRREAETVVPTLVGVPGVSAAWSLVSAPELAPPLWQSREGATSEEDTLIVTLTAVEDADPSHVLSLLSDPAAEWAAALHERSGTLLFDGALETITPWRWDWFDGDGTPGDDRHE